VSSSSGARVWFGLAALRRLRSRRQRRLTALATAGDTQTMPAPPGVSAIELAMMRRALALADQAAAMGEVPVGAVVFRGNEINAEAFNLRESASDPTGHAELIAMRKAGEALGEWRLSDCSLAVTLEPCPMCAGAMVNARISRVVYGAADPKAGACHTLYRIPTDVRLNHRVEIIGGVLEPECRGQLQAFFRGRRAKKP
jgi:tRNA(adenine34) deaminase